jgi:RimJ/RimL family protein N-acetyltransferase
VVALKFVEPVPWPDPDLTDGTVRLRPWVAADLPALGAAGADPEIQRFRYSAPAGEEKARRWLAEVEAARQAGKRLELAIAVDPEHDAVGSVSLTDIEPRTAMIRYWLLPEARGRGTAAGAVRLLAGWAIDVLQIAHIVLLIEPDNRSSWRLAERCGFVREARLRSYFRGGDGGRRDLLVYGLLPGELR